MSKATSHADSSPCPLAHALDLIGDRWTLLIVRDLMLRDMHEYKDMLRSYEGISTNILADRLQKMLQSGLIDYVPHPQNKTRKLYFLTTAGKELIHPMIALVKWSAEHVPTAKLPSYLSGPINSDPNEFVIGIFEQLTRWENENLTQKVAPEAPFACTR